MKCRRLKKQGFTLLELIVAIGIISLLVAASIPAYGKFKGKARKAVCISKMRAIHGAFAAAITDKGEWPQMPTDDQGNLPKIKQSDYFKFWRETMEPYGLAADTWVCPSDASGVASLKHNSEEFIGSYIPTWFSSGANIPFRWNQPWLVERAGFHGKGHHVVMPDGSVSESTNPFLGR